jgi:hypothetical protein
MISNARLKLQFDVNEPVELVDLTLALGSFGNQYQKFVEWKTRDTKIEPADFDDAVKLYVTKIESNCIITELAGFCASALPVIHHAVEYGKTYVEFAGYCNSAISFLKEKKLSKVWTFWKWQRRDCQDWANVLAPVAKHKPGRLHLAVVEQIEKDSTKRLIDYSYESDAVVAAQQGAIKQLESQELEEAADHKKVVMHIPQMHETKVKKTGKSSPDLGIIESIYPKELPILWLSDMDARRVKSQKKSPFSLNYVVDVNVQRVGGVPRAYRILKLHDLLPDAAS